MAKSYLPAAEFARALEEAGVITDLNSITRVVIDLDPHDLVKVYVERIASPGLKQAAGLLGEMMRDGRAVNPDAPKGVRYWSPFPPAVLEDDWMQGVLRSCGLRIIEQGPWRDKHSRLCLVEDPGAPEDLAGRTVELTFDLQSGTPTRVAQREVIA